MSTSPVNFWQQLKRSRILPAGSIPSLAAKFQSTQADSTGPQSISSWLIDQKIISRFQAEILSAGYAERLTYGNYVIYDRLNSADDWALFRGLHQASGHKVLLFFVSGESVGSGDRWNELADECNQWKRATSPAVVSILDVVVLSEYRMFVIDDVPGVMLSDKVPEKSRMPLEKSLRVCRQIARTLDSLHQQKIVHGNLSLDSILIDNSGAVRLLPPLLAGKIQPQENNDSNGNSENRRFVSPVAPEVLADPDLKVRASDAYSLGTLLHRLVAGKLPKLKTNSKSNSGQNPQRIELADPKKLDYSPKINDLLLQMLAADPVDRMFEMSKIDGELQSLSKKQDFEFPQPQISQSLAEFKLWQEKWVPDSGDSEFSIDVRTPDDVKSTSEENNSETGKTVLPALAVAADEKKDAQQTSAMRSAFRRRQQILMASGVSAALLMMITMFAYLGYIIGQSENVAVRNSTNGVSPKKTDKSTAPIANGTTTNKSPTKNRTDVAYNQEIVTNSDLGLWESPTTGLPYHYRLVPPSSRLIMSVRLAELLENEEGKLIVQALGDSTSNWIEKLPEKCGCTANEIERMHVSLHSDTNQFQSCFVIQLRQPMAESKLIARWQTAQPKTTGNGQNYYEKDGTAFFFPPAADPSGETIVESFIFGPPGLLEPVIDARGNTRLDGTLGKLATKSDRNRHFSMLFLRSAIVSEEGQRLMAGPWATLHRPIAVQLDERIRGVLVSAHLADGVYWDATFERTVDLKVNDWKQSVEKTLRDATNEIETSVSNIAPHPYWNKVKVRFDDMIKTTYLNTRVGIERQEVLINCWLPPMAAHNLIAATEVVLSAAPSSNVTVATPTKSAPQTIEELLATKRDLQDGNPPDLNVLLENFKNGILNDYASLPFEFDIVVDGADLGDEGITRNQRPSALDLKQMSISEILTQIMFLANPDKNAKNPNDVLCKLVWVIKTEESNPGKKTILVTTRKAVAQKGYKLPAAFALQE